MSRIPARLARLGGMLGLTRPPQSGTNTNIAGAGQPLPGAPFAAGPQAVDTGSAPPKTSPVFLETPPPPSGWSGSPTSNLRAFAKATWKHLNAPLFAREVVYEHDKDGKPVKVLGPASQYVASAISNNRSPFTSMTAAKVALYLSLVYGFMKTGILNSPASAVSAADDVGDTIVALVGSALDGNPELDTHYFNGFMNSVFKCDPNNPADKPNVTCYQPGGRYYELAEANPHRARLWGYAEGLSPLAKEVLGGLLLAAGGGAFVYANRRRLQGLVQQVFSNGPALTRADWVAMATSAAGVGALTAGAMAFTFGLSREVAHPAAAWLMLSAAAYMVAHEYRSPIQQVRGSRDIPMGLALLFGGMWIGGDALYRSLADSAGLYQFTRNGFATIYGNWGKWDWVMNFPLLAADLATEFFLLAPVWARSGGLVQNSVEVVTAALARRIHGDKKNPGAIRRWLQERVPELHARVNDGVVWPDYMEVRSRIQAFADNEKLAVREGKLPPGLPSKAIGHLMTAGGLAALGYEGAIGSLGTLLAHDSHHVVADVLLATLGLGATGLLADAAIRDGVGRRLYRSLASFFGHQFGPNGRGLFWAVYTLVGTTFTAGIGVTSQTIKGFTPDLNYVLNIVIRSLINPWVNRLHMGWWAAYRPDKALSKFGFFVPGFFIVYCGIEFGGENGQMNQSTSLLYEDAARQFSLTEDPDQKSLLLEKLTGIEALVREAQENGGYGRPDTLERAQKTLAAIENFKRHYHVPDILP